MPIASFSSRLAQLAADEPGAPAVTAVAADGSVSMAVDRFELERRSTRLARHLLSRRRRAVGSICVAYPNGVEHVLAVLASWKAGGMVVPISSTIPASEHERLTHLIGPDVLFADHFDAPETITRDELRALAADGAVAPLPDVVPEPGKAIASGGSTGAPKLIVDPRPWSFDIDSPLGDIGDAVRFGQSHVQLVAGPLHHNMAFMWAMLGLFAGQHLVVMERFDAGLALELIARHRVEFVAVVPTMLQRMAQHPDFGHRDLSSLVTLLHSAAPCPPWAKRAWLNRVDPAVVVEGYGATEGVGQTIVAGDEWLRRPGTVGRPVACEVVVLDDEGRRVPPGIVGNVFLRPQADDTFHYIGADPPPRTPEGFVTVGDFGSVDEDGYLFLVSRRTDVITTGGVKVYPAEVEAVLSEHDAVADVVVVGLPDADLGQRVHAIVQLRAGKTHGTEEILAYCRSRLSATKAPRAIELVRRLPRDEAGKVRRSALVADRSCQC
jgi:bile acid-coenzyme A ligase